jgi:hypothetical protein
MVVLHKRIVDKGFWQHMSNGIQHYWSIYMYLKKLCLGLISYNFEVLDVGMFVPFE